MCECYHWHMFVWFKIVSCMQVICYLLTETNSMSLAAAVAESSYNVKWKMSMSPVAFENVRYTENCKTNISNVSKETFGGRNVNLQRKRCVFTCVCIRGCSDRQQFIWMGAVRWIGLTLQTANKRQPAKKVNRTQLLPQCNPTSSSKALHWPITYTQAHILGEFHI